MKHQLFVSLFILLIFCNCKHDEVKNDVVIGIKIYEQLDNYEKLFREWKEIGINTAFVSVALAYDESFREKALENDVDVFIILPIFFNSEVLQQHPEWYAITQTGEKAKEEWVEFISPSIEVYRVDRIAEIKKIVKETKPTGISIDFIRYFAFWEKVHAGRTLASIQNTSFDSLSVANFQVDNGFKIPEELETITQKAAWILDNHEESWTSWKCNNIVSMVKNIVEATKDIQPDLLVNLHAVPWRQNDFGGAIRKITGQDFKELSKFTDYISPMCYSHMLKQDAEWVVSVVQDIVKQAGEVAVLPSIQVKEAYLDERLTDEEFEKNLIAALVAPSRGVIFWSWENLELDSVKKSIINKLINNRL